MLTHSNFTTPREGTPSRHRMKPRHTLLAWQRNGLTAGSQDSTLKADRIGGVSDGTPEEAERGRRLETPPPHPQAVPTVAGPEGGREATEAARKVSLVVIGRFARPQLLHFANAGTLISTGESVPRKRGGGEPPSPVKITTRNLRRRLVVVIFSEA